MNTQSTTTGAPKAAPREPYRAPQLTIHGPLQRLTLGPTPSATGGTGVIPGDPNGTGNGT